MNTTTAFSTVRPPTTVTLTRLLAALVVTLLVAAFVAVLALSPVLWTAAGMVLAVFLVPLGLPVLAIWTVTGEF